MSTTIDQRVVEMRFDNKNFENNVSHTMSTLDKLKQKLNLTGASKSIDEVNNAAKRLDMSYLANGVESVSAKFSAMQVIGITALTNITNQAVNAGKRIASALTIDPIKTGFSEYETQINSVQTILANTESKGTTLNDVNSALDTLNTYADKTIYNFTEMTRNIGTFTAAGVDLSTSVNAIQGIANLAAVSGSTSQQASTAMYQLSQALSSGTVKLMDWNSVVNAGMGGQVFQDALKETARVHGIAIDSMIEEQGSFRETLQEGWLTSEILTETLSKFTMTTEGLTDAQIEQNRQSLKAKGYTDEQIESIFKLGKTATDAATKVKTMTQLWDTLKESAQSGWTQTWETIVGDFGEAKELWTEVSNVVGEMIGKSADSRNALLSGALDSNWKKMIGSLNDAGIETNKFEEKLRKTLENHGHNVDALIEEHGSLEKVFKSGAVSSDVLREAVDALNGSMVDLSSIERELKKGLKGDDIKLAQEALQNLGMDLGKAGIDGIFGKNTEAAVKSFQELKGLEVTGIIDEKTLAALQEANTSTVELTESCYGFIDAITEMGGREKIIQSVKNIFEGLMNVAKPIKEAFREVFPPTTVEQVTNVIDKFQELSERFKEFTASHGEQIKATFHGIFSVLDIGVTFIKDLAGGFVTLLGKLLGFSGGLLDTTASIGEWLSNLRDSIKEGDVFGRSIDKIVDFLSKGIDKLREFGRSIKDSFEAPGYNGFLGFLKGTWEFVSKLSAGIAKAFGSIGQVIANIFGDNTFGDVLDSGIFAAFMVGMYKLVDAIRSPLDALSDGLEHITGDDGIFANVKNIFDDVRGCLQAYQDQLKAGTLLKIAGAIGILAASIFVISTIDAERLGTSLGAITVLFGELLGALAIFSKIGGAFKGAFKAMPLMISMATSILILSLALKVMSSLSLKEMGVALLGLTVSMAALIGAVNLLPKKNVSKAAKAIRTMATSLLILSVALKIMGSMSWGEIARGLTAAVVGLAAMVGAVNLLPKGLGTRTAGMIALALSLVVLGGALKIMGSMSWMEIGKGLATLAGSLLAITLAMRFMPKNMLFIGTGLIAVAASLVIVSAALKIMGSMTWEEIAKGLVALGGALLELAIGLNLMRGTLSGSAALLIAAVALAIITPTLMALGSLSWESIGKGLVALAGAFVVIGLAGLLLSPVIPALLGLAGALALFGVATVTVGAGLVLIGAGITAISTSLAVGTTAIVAAISAIVLGVLDLIPNILLRFKDIILAVCNVIVDCAPQIAETILVLVAEILKSLATYIPQIADSLFELLIGLLDVISARLPELITAAVKVIGAFFQGIVDALGSLDMNTMLQGIAAVGLLSGLMFALSAVASLTPGAMLGVLGIGAVIAELTLVLAAIGGLAQIPGLEWLVSEGGNFLQTLGTAIGQFFGGLAGGIAQGFSSSLPQIGTDLSDFMTNLQPFIDGAKTIDGSVMDGVKTLVGVLLAITGANIVEGLTSWITGGSSLTEFGSEIAAFAPYMKQYADAISGVDASTITASANAAKALSELATSLPNSGGVAGFFAGENDLSEFAKQLIPFGEGLKGYATAVAGIDVQAIISSATAAKAIVEMTNSIPNSGGVVSWFTGDNSIANFGTELIGLGEGLKGFSDSISGVNNEAIMAIVPSAKALVEMTSHIPNSGGVLAWLAGDNSITKFAWDLPRLGEGLKGFSDAIAGVVPENIIAAASAAKSLAEMTSIIPNEGGVAAWFAGDNAVAKFASDMVLLGEGLANFSLAIVDVNPENLTSAASAAKAIAEMCATIPNEGGMVAWFTGDNSVAKFASELPLLGEGLKGFSDSIVGIVPENITAAANAAKSLAQMVNVIPNEGGIKAWFTGETSVAKFAEHLPSLGEGLKGFSDNIAGIVPENITAAATAAKTLAQMADTTPKKTDKLVEFGTNLVSFGEKLKTYFDTTSVITPESATNTTKIINSVKTAATINSESVGNAASAINKLVDALKRLPSISENTVSGFTKAMDVLGKTSVDKLVNSFTNAAPKLTASGSKLVEAVNTGVKSKEHVLSQTSNTMVEGMVNTINAKSNLFNNASSKLMDALVSGIRNGAPKATAALTTTISGVVNSIRGCYSSFYSAGSYLVDGFASGISANSYKAAAKASAMASAAVQAAQAALGINSPSKVFYQIGEYTGQGLINALVDYGSKVYNAGSDMGDSARSGLSDAISTVKDIINGEVDMQPTIRPVLDLSNVQAGAGAINGMFGSSVGLMANVGTINSMMNNRQNGASDDVVSAINALRKDLENVGNTTYTINGITYDDGSNVSDAIKTLVRAAKVERRI